MVWIFVVYALAISLGGISGYFYARSYKSNEKIIFFPFIVSLIAGGLLSTESDWWQFIVVIFVWIIVCIFSYFATRMYSGSMSISEKRNEYLHEGYCPNCRKPLPANTLKCSECDDGRICPRCGSCTNIANHK